MTFKIRHAYTICLGSNFATADYYSLIRYSNQSLIVNGEEGTMTFSTNDNDRITFSRVPEIRCDAEISPTQCHDSVKIKARAELWPASLTTAT